MKNENDAINIMFYHQKGSNIEWYIAATQRYR